MYNHYTQFLKLFHEVCLFYYWMFDYETSKQVDNTVKWDSILGFVKSSTHFELQKLGHVLNSTTSLSISFTADI